MLKTAAMAGIKPLEFWDMTPAELTIVVGAYSDNKTHMLKQDITVAYMNAAWQRAKKMPKLDTVIIKIDHTSKSKKKKAQTPAEMMAVFKVMAGK